MGEVVSLFGERRKKKRLPEPPLQKGFTYVEYEIPRGEDCDEFIAKMSHDIAELFMNGGAGASMTMGYVEEEGEA